MVTFYDYTMKKFIQVDMVNSIKLAHKELLEEVSNGKPLFQSFDNAEKQLNDKALNMLKNLKYKQYGKKGQSVTYICTEYELPASS